MSGATIITESGTDILYIDFSGLSGNDFLQAIQHVTDFCLHLPEDKFYPSITDLTRAKTNGDVRDALKEMGKALETRKHPSTPRPKAVIGLSGLQRTVASAFIKNTKFFDTKKEAIDYIVKASALA